MIARNAEVDKEDVDRAVDAARNAFRKGSWPKTIAFVVLTNIYVRRTTFSFLNNFTLFH